MKQVYPSIGDLCLFLKKDNLKITGYCGPKGSIKIEDTGKQEIYDHILKPELITSK